MMFLFPSSFCSDFFFLLLLWPVNTYFVFTVFSLAETGNKPHWRVWKYFYSVSLNIFCYQTQNIIKQALKAASYTVSVTL